MRKRQRRGITAAIYIHGGPRPRGGVGSVAN